MEDNQIKESRQRPETCSICIETFNYVGRKKVVCDKCDAKICTKCIKKFLADNVQEPNCMNCREVYTNKFMDNNFGYNYRRTVLKNVRLQVLVAREKQIMPDLMHRAEAYKKCMKYENKRFEVRKQINKLEKSLDEVYTTKDKLDEILKNNTANIDEVDVKLSDEFMKSITEAIVNANKAQTELENELNDLENKNEKYWKRIIELNKIYRYGGTQKVSSVMNCLKTNCKGFLDDNYVCGLCHMKVCKDCHEELVVNDENNDEAEHVCKPENVESVKTIENETRQCPTCRSRVYKSEGCDQMFCVQCHTAFNWITGMVERGRIHNPHYFEWLRSKKQQMPREVGDVPCGGLPSWYVIRNHLNKHDIHFTMTTYLRSVYKMAEYIQNKEIPKYPVSEGRDDELNMMAIHYMADLLPENKWKNKLYQFERKKEVNTERRLILDMMIAVLVDLFGDVCSLVDEQAIKEKVNEFNEIRQYFNQSISNLGKRYDMYNFKGIDKTWMSWEY